MHNLPTNNETNIIKSIFNTSLNEQIGRARLPEVIPGFTPTPFGLIPGKLQPISVTPEFTPVNQTGPKVTPGFTPTPFGQIPGKLQPTGSPSSAPSVAPTGKHFYPGTFVGREMAPDEVAPQTPPPGSRPEEIGMKGTALSQHLQKRISKRQYNAWKKEGLTDEQILERIQKLREAGRKFRESLPNPSQQKSQKSQQAQRGDITPAGEEARRQERVRTGETSGRVVQPEDVVSPWKDDLPKPGQAVGAAGTVRDTSDWGSSIRRKYTGYYQYPHPKAGMRITDEDKKSLASRGVDISNPVPANPDGSPIEVTTKSEEEDGVNENYLPNYNPGIREQHDPTSYYNRLNEAIGINLDAYGRDKKGKKRARRFLERQKSHPHAAFGAGDSSTVEDLPDESPKERVADPESFMKTAAINILKDAQSRGIKMTHGQIQQQALDMLKKYMGQ